MGDDARILFHAGDKADAGWVCTVTRTGLAIEVGPTPQGMLRHDAVALTEAAVHHVLDFYHLVNTGKAPAPPPTVKVWDYLRKISWPVDSDGFPTALVSPGIQDRDFVRDEGVAAAAGGGLRYCYARPD